MLPGLLDHREVIYVWKAFLSVWLFLLVCVGPLLNASDAEELYFECIEEAEAPKRGRHSAHFAGEFLFLVDRYYEIFLQTKTYPKSSLCLPHVPHRVKVIN